MSSLIANKVETNMFQLNSLLSALSYMQLFKFCTMYTTIICLFVICIRQLFVSFSQRRSSNHDCFVHTQLHTRLTEFLLLALACFVLPFICARLQCDEGS